MQTSQAHNRIRIVDLDSTISDDSWRLWLIDPNLPDGTEKYHSYHIHCDGDSVMNRYIVDESPCEVFLLTARPEYTRQKTVDWLRDNDLRYTALMMRPNDSHISSVHLKRNWVEKLHRNWMFEFENGYDDRQDIVDMYNSYGIKGILVS